MNKDWTKTDNFVEMSKSKKARLKRKLSEQLIEAGVLEYNPKNKQAGKTLKKLMKRMTDGEIEVLKEMIGNDFL